MQWLTSDCGKYRIESMSRDTIPAALTLIKEEFCQDEYVCMATKVNENDQAAEELVELCADAILDGVSVVAVEIATGKVVSTLVNKLQVFDPNETEKTYFEVFMEERCKHPSARAVMNLMIDLDGRINLFEKYNTDCAFELMFLTTAREHRRRKLAFLCFKASIEIARKLKNGPVTKITLQDLGPKYSYMKPRKVTNKVPKICTSLGSSIGTQTIGKNLNFILEARVPCTEFTFDGMNYVERLGFDPCIDTIVKVLD